jgi:hypothetical protein
MAAGYRAVPTIGRDRVALQMNSRLTRLTASDLLHYRYCFAEEQDSHDMAFVVATVAQASDVELIGQDVALSYADCQFVGTVDLTG